MNDSSAEINRVLARRRRLSIGGGRGGRGGASSGSSEELPEEVSEGINDQVLDIATTVRRNSPDLNEQASPISVSDDEISPAGRMQALAAVDSNYAIAYRRTLVLRMLMRSLPLDRIASDLGVSINTIQRDKKFLANKLKEEAANMDANQHIGQVMAEIKEVFSIAMRMASMSSSSITHASKLQALRTALAAKDSMARFLSTTGVYDVLTYKQEDKKNKDDIAVLADTASLIAKALREDSDLTQEDLDELYKIGENKDDDDDSDYMDLDLL